MIRDKRVVAAAVVGVILLSFVLYVLIVRRSQADQERRAQRIVQRWYVRHGRPDAQVERCKLVDLGDNVIDGFDCRVAGACAGTHTFLVPRKGNVRPYRNEAAC
jgi:hypothetical protein